LWCGASSVQAQGAGAEIRARGDVTASRPNPITGGIPLSGLPTSDSGARRPADISAQVLKLGDQARLMNNYKDASEWYTYALKLNAKEAHAHFGMGEVYTAFNRFDEAVKSYEQALALKPKMVEAHVGLGRALFKQQLLDQAIRSFQQAIALKPKSAEGYLGIGDCYFTQKKYAEAVEAYQKTIELKSNSLEAHYNLGITYFVSGNRAAAIEQGRIVKSLNKAASEKFEGVLKRLDAQHK
jgi:tetratricopeptide (TPR) repeat protein